MHTGKSMGRKSIYLGIILGLFFSSLGLLYHNSTNCNHKITPHNGKYKYSHTHSHNKCNHSHKYNHKYHKKKNNDLTDYYFYRNIVPIYPK